MRKLLAVCALLGVSCGYPAFTSALRSNFDSNTKVETSCSRIDRKNIPEHVKNASPDGWRLAFVSEYTSTAKSDFPSLICMERAK